MLKQLTHTQVWVHDQDEALDFYTEKLGMELREDVTVPEMGNFRWLSVGVPGQDDVAITLMAVPGPPVFDEGHTGEDPGAAREGRLRWALLLHGRRSGHVRGAQGPRRRVLSGAHRAAVRNRRRFPRPVGQPVPGGAAGLDRNPAAVAL